MGSKSLLSLVPFDDARSGAADYDLAGYEDWRLPNAKELQTLVDYDRAPPLPTRPVHLCGVQRRTPVDSPAGRPYAAVSEAPRRGLAR